MDANGPEYRNRKNICAYLCLSVALTLLPACSTLRGAGPDWVQNPKAVYPDNRFLVAIGEGDTRRAAENAAAANLSRIFESHIESDERVVDKVRESDQDFSRTTALSSDVSILSSQTLINIQHAEAWKDDNGRYHAVAYLDRRDTAEIYRDKIEEKNALVQSLISHAGQAETPLEKYARLRSASRIALENDLMLRRLRVIHPAVAAASEPPYSFGELQKATADSAKQVRVRITLKNDTDGRMTSFLEELITRYGFVSGEPAVLDVTGRISIADSNLRANGLAYFRYNLFIQIKDSGGRVLAAINEKGNEAVTRPADARNRCYRTMENAVKVSGVRSLDAYFDSLVEQ